MFIADSRKLSFAKKSPRRARAELEGLVNEVLKKNTNLHTQVSCSFFTSVDGAVRLERSEELVMLGMQEMKKLKQKPSPVEPYLSQAQAAVAAARKSLRMSPREVLYSFSKNM